ncbi:Beta-propeller domains of methanol dehydrogenase type [Sandaracinus amylolyticus]|uniref:Beta-propeller domains of methanol dehydrogenase type n=2 Tax=Sandaracinus amylolyticus TaxID=927083 RepID=A0A0F6WA20_9BACT|nr:Beta-propeller domains of methanol dehydrogenase type [Sandaracinus amylolyticus]
MKVERHDRPLRALAVSVALWALGASVASAQTPLPRRTDRAVYDVAEVIDPERERVIEQVNHELYAKAGVAIVVITVPALQDETIDELAVRVGHTWGIGGEGRDRGLVIAFSRDDRRIFVATGYGTEGYLPDGRVGALIDERAIPFLRANQFGEGLLRLDLALAAISAQEYGVTLTGVAAPSASARPAQPPGPMQLVMWALIGIVFLYLAIRHPRLLLFMLMTSGGGRHRGGGGFGGGGGGFGGGGGGFGGGGAGRGF